MSECVCRGSMGWDPPNMRIVLLGKNEAENCRVGNAILGRAAFDPKTPPGSRKPKLNLVLCGREGSLKASVSKLLRGRRSKPPSSHQKESKVCVKKEGEAYGRQITVVELPALTSTDLSEEEVKRETLSCVSLCDPGVHAFLFIYPDGPCTDEDKAEIEKIQRIFDPREHIILLLITDTVDKPVSDLVEFGTECQRLICLCGGLYEMVGLKEVLLYIENIMTEPYSRNMYMRAQEQRVRHDLKEKHKDQLKEMDKTRVTAEELQQKIPLESVEDDLDCLKCLRIVLIGKTGNGKSATGNTILGRKEFLSQLNARSVTNVCQKGFGEVDGKSVAVIDTPGLFDTTLTNEQVQEEMIKCISLSAPGPHAFIIVLTVGRFTSEDISTVDLIKKMLGPKAAQFSIVLFTRGDELEDETIEDYVKRGDSAELNKLLRDCENRFLAFNNKVNDSTQVTRLLNMIEMMMKSNTEEYFTMFEEAEMSIKKRMEEILKEKEREIQAEMEKLKFKYYMQWLQLRKRLEEEKKIDEERVEMCTENMFKEKVNLRKESEEKEETAKQKHQQKIEREQKKQGYEEGMEELKEEWERKKQYYDNRREKESKRWEKIIEDVKQELEKESRRKEKEEQARKREERVCYELNKEFEQKIKEVQRKHEDEARKLAEQDIKINLKI